MKNNPNMYYSCAVVSTSTGSLDYLPNRDSNIHILRLNIYLKDQVYLDGQDIEADELYQWMIDNPDVAPKTSPPTMDSVVDFFFGLHKKGYREALVITISEAMSETKKIIEEVAILLSQKIKIHIFDSGTSAIAEGMMAQKASEWLYQGASVQTVLNKLPELRDNSVSFVFTSTLSYLVKNKKISMIQGLLGSWLHIKPILHFENGQVRMQGKVKNINDGLDRIIESMEKHHYPLEDSELYILYCGNDDIYNALYNKISDHFQIQPQSFPLSPVVGAYSGPKAVGVAILPKIADFIHI